MKAERYPLDTDKLNEGDYITPPECGAILGMEPCEGNKYALALLRLSSRIQSEIRKSGRKIVVKIEGQGIRLLSASEGSEYRHKRFKAHLRGAGREYYGLRVDVSADRLSAEETLIHDRRLTVQGALVAAIKRTRRELPSE